MSSAPVEGAAAVKNTPATIVAKRRKPAADPFFSGPKPRVPVINGKLKATTSKAPNGVLSKPPALKGPKKVLTQSRTDNKSDKISADHVSGFSDPNVKQYTDYKLVTTRKDLLDGMRFHILQMTGDKTVDIRNEDVFPKPARLHRRDPFTVSQNESREEVADPRDGLNAVEREDLNRRKEIRQKEREANLAQIAPSQSTARKVPQFKKKIQEVKRMELTAEDRKRMQMNYEEKLPWHLEDFDSKHCFIGKNQQGSANMHIGLVLEQGKDGAAARFRMVPVEKLYHFKRKSTFRTLTAEEAEAAMSSKKQRLPQWLEDIEAKRHQELLTEKKEQRARSERLYTGAQTERRSGRKDEDADLDWDAEEDFADDEEGGLFDDRDEDEKLAEKKIKEDLLKANIFSMNTEQEVDEEEARELREELERKVGSRAIKKALEKRERNYNHGSDSEEYTETDSEEERERLEREKQNLKKEEDGDKSALPSGTNTPSGRREKHSGTASDREGMKKSLSSRSLKRPGSPNLSDASGTDTSTRKKHKIRHPPSSQPTPGISRAQSPSRQPRPRAGIRGGSFAGSDSEAGPGSDADRPRVKLRINSPIGSRSGSPGPQNISRPGSTVSDPKAAPPDEVFIKEVISRADGITSKDLFTAINQHPGIKGHPDGADRKRATMVLVQKLAKLDKESGKLYLKKSANGT